MPLTNALAQEIARVYGTPAVTIDLERVEANIARVQAACEAAGLANRPHIKTHKSPLLARMQRDAGARGIACQKLGEAEVMAAAGLDDILIAYNLLGEEKLGRLAALMRRAQVTVAADSAVTVAGLPRAAAAAGRDLDVVVECDTGMRRAGVETPTEAIALALDISSRPGLRFAGLLLYSPVDRTAETSAFLDEALAGLRESGLEPRIVSTGGTPFLSQLAAIAAATEHRAGTYVFNDRMMLRAGAAALDDVALFVVSTVASRGAPERIARFSEEHGMLDLSACNDRPKVGDVVRIVPNHVCPVVNLADRLIAIRGDAIVGEVEVEARGKNG